MLKDSVEGLDAISQSLALLGQLLRQLVLLGCQCAQLLGPAGQESILLPGQVQQLLLKGGGLICCFRGPSGESKGSTGAGIKDREGSKVSKLVAAGDAEVGDTGGKNEDMDEWKTPQKSKGSVQGLAVPTHSLYR